MTFFRLVVAAAVLASLPACTPPEPPPVSESIVLIVVDTLRADHLGCYGYPRETTPAIDGWAESGRLYENARAPSSWTVPSFASIYTGHHPARHGAGYGERDVERPTFTVVDPIVPTLAEQLSEAGYRTGAVVTNTFLGPDFLMDRGFDHYEFDEPVGADYRRAAAAVDAALRWLDAGTEEAPSFLVLHLFDPHMPYGAPAPERGRFTGELRSELTLPVEGVRDLREGRIGASDEDRRFLVAAYDEEVAFVDRQIDRLLEALRERGLLDRGLVVLTSDHGEEFFEHGGFEHGHTLYRELLHVPLIVWGRGVQPGRDGEAVTLIDLAPTIYAFAGVEHEPLPGRPLTDKGARPLFAEGTLYGSDLASVIDGRHKLIVGQGGVAPRLFDLDADPGETENVLDEQGAVARRLFGLLGDRIRADLDQRVEKVMEVDPERVEKLRSLGYL